jgi:hypothetical protein
MRSTTCYSDARANQTLDQTAAIVQRYGESTRPPLISFTVRLSYHDLNYLYLLQRFDPKLGCRRNGWAMPPLCGRRGKMCGVWQTNDATTGNHGR